MRCALAPTLVALALAGGPSAAQEPRDEADLAHQVEALRRQVETQSSSLEQLQKKVDDVLWFDRVGDVAEIDKVYIPTVPVPKEEETYGIANARHPFRMWTYVFVPKGADPAKKRPAAPAAARRRPRRLHHVPHPHRPRADGGGLRGRGS